MKLFGYVLIGSVLLLAAALGFPALQMGKYLLTFSILSVAIILCVWIYAIYGPLNTRYTQAKGRLIGVIARPFGLLMIAGCLAFFAYRVVEPVLASRCEIDTSTTVRGAIFRTFFNHACSDLGPIGFSLANLPFVIIFAFFLWLGLDKPNPWRKA